MCKVREITIFCDDTSCNKWYRGFQNRDNTFKKIMNEAYKLGWRKIKRKDYCPDHVQTKHKRAAKGAKNK